MRLRRAVVVSTAGFALPISACAGGGEPATVFVTSTQWVAAETEQAEQGEQAEPEVAEDAEALAPSSRADSGYEPVTLDEQGNARFTGIVEAWPTEKAAQGRETPAGEDPRNIYYVLVFDSPVSVAANKAGSTVTQESPFARLGFVHHSSSGVLDQSKGWEEYVGKRVEVWSPLNRYGYSSDLSLPFGSQLWIDTEHVEVLD